VHRLLEAVPGLPRGGCWMDPCAGEGAIIKAARQVEPDTKWRALELRSECEEALSAIPNCTVSIGDFRSEELPPANQVDVILMNPPYRLAHEFIIQSMKIAPHVVALLRLNFLGSDLRAEWLSMWMPDVRVLPNRPKFRSGPGTDSIEYAWMSWESGIPSATGTICVLPPTSKAERGVRGGKTSNR